MAAADDPRVDDLRLALLLPHAAREARAGRYAEAQRWLEALLQHRPDPDVHCLLGKVQAQQGWVEPARAAFRAALALAPDHREALASLACLDRRAPLTRKRALQAAALGLIAAVAGTSLWMGGREPPRDLVAAAPPVLAAPPLPDPPAAPEASRSTAPSTVASATISAAASTAPSAAASAGDPSARLRRFDAYAQFVAALRLVDGSLRVSAIDDADTLAVRLQGSLPTDHVHDRVLGLSMAYRDLRVDTAALEVVHRYRVRPGDRLWSIARQLYGDAARWRELWEANRGAVPNPSRLRPGTLLMTP